MLRISPFRGVRFDWGRVKLSDVLCPPYDVIAEGQERRLRDLPLNAIHVELPRGGPARRYLQAAKRWHRWLEDGSLVREARPSYYLLEQRFRAAGRFHRRTGLLASLGLEASSAGRVLPHERTFPKPKRDRLLLLRALEANTSPIFLLYSDPLRRVRRLLSRRLRSPAHAAGTEIDGTRVRVWRIDEPGYVLAIERAFRGKTALVADGHHRLKVAGTYRRRCGRAQARGTLCYLCAEEDPGLVVFPTHRYLPRSGRTLERVRALCRLVPCRGFPDLERALARHPSPLAFGLISPGGCSMAVPRAGTLGGLRNRLGVEWLDARVFRRLGRDGVRYTHDSKRASRWVSEEGGLSILVKGLTVGQIRRAVAHGGLLPQKSTYFYPKVPAGAVFHPARG